MGVVGLSSFIKRFRKKLLRRHSLRGTAIVIDGSNLMYELNVRACGAFGGDYQTYAKQVKKFFQRLRECQISPYVVLDGSTRIKQNRLRKKLVCVTKTKSGQKKKWCPALPLLTRIVFVQVLKEMGIPHAQCTLEADQEIVALARGLSCPILSNDSDFCIFNVDVVLLRTLDHHMSYDSEDGSAYLKCEMYQMKHLLRYFGGVDSSLLPLIATLVGNDQMPQSIGRKLYANLPRRGMHKMREQHRRIVGLFSCFQHTTLTCAVKLILHCAKKEERKYISSLIRTSIDWYLMSHTNLASYLGVEISSAFSANVPDDLKETLENCSEIIDDPSSNSTVEDVALSLEECLIVKENSEESEFSSSSSSSDSDDTEEDENEENVESETQGETRLPQWFWQEFHQSKLPPICMDILHRKVLLLPCQVEEICLDSTHIVSLPILQFLCGFLVKGSAVTKIFCYIRKRKRNFKMTLVPNFQLSDFGEIPNLNRVRELSLKNRKQLLTYVLKFFEEDVDVVESFCADLKLFVYSLLYWLHNTKPALTEYHLSGVILCMISQVAIKKHKAVLENVPLVHHELQSGSKNLQVFYQAQSKWDMTHSSLSISLIHAYSQLQACFFHIYNLNCLLGCPFINSDPTSVFHSSFFYHLTCELQKRPNPFAYIEHLLGRGTALHALFIKIVQSITAVLPQMEWQKMKVKQTKKKNKKRKKVVNKDVASSSEKSDSSLSSSEDICCDSESTNRFFLLKHGGND